MNEGERRYARGQQVMSADGLLVGTLEGDESTHLRVRLATDDTPSSHAYLPKSVVRGEETGMLWLNINRADLHEAVYTLQPGQQREYATLGAPAGFGRRLAAPAEDPIRP